MTDIVNYKEDILSVFKCHQTGNCCRAEGFVYASDPDIVDMAAVLDLSVLSFREKYVLKKDNQNILASSQFRPACFLDSQNKCSIYSARPQKCKTYPHWPELWESEESIKKEITLCKGLRHAYQWVKDQQKEA